MARKTPDIDRVRPKDADGLAKTLVPTRGVIEVRLYDFDAERYRYLPSYRQQFTVVSVAELRRLWRILQRAIVVGEAHWRDKDAGLAPPPPPEPEVVDDRDPEYAAGIPE